MKNAHLRLGKMSFWKTVGKSDTNFNLPMDRFIGDRASDGSLCAHFLSVFGGDAQVAGASAIISENELFTVEGPGLQELRVRMGTDAACYRASIVISTAKRPVRHLIAVSKEFSEQVNADTKTRTLLADSSPDYLWNSIAQLFGLPSLPQWADWFYERLRDNLAITPIFGLGCSPVSISGSKEEFLHWLSEGIRRREIKFPDANGPSNWPTIDLQRILLPPVDVPPDANAMIQ